MTPTILGGILIAAGCWLLLRGGVVAMFGLVVVSSLFGGSAAFLLPALGGSSVALPGSGQSDLVGASLRDNLPLAIFVVYGVVMAIVGPRLFGDLIRVAPMRQANGPLFATLPLAATSQNLTTAFYMTGTLLRAAGSYVACRDPRGLRMLVGAGIVTAWAHVGFGILSVFGDNGVAAATLGFFRNAGYAQLNQEVEGVVRITGIQPEPSSFAVVSVGWVAFMFECWSLKVRPRATGPLALSLFVILIAATSTSGYVGLVSYGAIRLCLAFSRGGTRRSLSLLALVFAAIIGGAALTYLYPAVLDSAARIYDAVIAKKQSSDSGLQRAFWARQGLEVFVASNGLGIGPGSFRSSSIVTAIIGSTGVIGAAAFVAYLARLAIGQAGPRPTSAEDERARIGIAATWAALSYFFVAAVVSASPDPTAFFAIFAGAGLAARRPSTAPSAARTAIARPARGLAMPSR